MVSTSGMHACDRRLCACGAVYCVTVFEWCAMYLIFPFMPMAFWTVATVACTALTMVTIVCNNGSDLYLTWL